MAEYRIDELARVADATVRNIRVYQDRGLLPPPRRDGRVGLYTDAHLARLRLIGQLLKRGYTFATIGELLTVWQRGGDIAEILDLESAVGLPWSDEVPAYVTPPQLADLFGAEATPENVAQAVRQGLLQPDPAPQTPPAPPTPPTPPVPKAPSAPADPLASETTSAPEDPPARYRVPSPRLLNAGAELVAAGMPLPAVLDLAERLREHMDAAARDLAVTVTRHVLANRLQDGLLQGQDIADVAEITRRLRPLAQTAVDALLAQGMAQHVPEALGDHFARVLDHLERDKSVPAS
jgi:DNA-binding transcriptional MerR regulator